eukprot:g2145.t1
MSTRTVAFTPSKGVFGRKLGRNVTASKLQRRRRSLKVTASSVQSKLTQLETLRSMSTVVADTGEIDLVKKYKPIDCTTNPSLVLKAVQQPEYERFLKQAVEEEAVSPGPSLANRPFASIADRLAVLIGCELLEIVPGRVSTEVDAHLSYDTNATVEKAQRLVELYKAKGIDTKRLYIKIASTWEGIRACEILKEKGIDCNMTLLFSFAQAVACGQAGAALISPFVGRILDWYKANTGRDYAPEEDPGVQSVQRIYKYYKAYGVKTIVMAASFRNIGEIQQLAGCDNITISPQLLEELEQSKEPLPRMLQPVVGSSEDSEILQMDEVLFRKMHEADQMAFEKLKEGIEKFAEDQRKLEDMIGKLIE